MSDKPSVSPYDDLQAIGRISEPLRRDVAADKYVPVLGNDTFHEVG